ncbi:hypothetical protein GCM10010460_12200 [Microbacterium terrae]|nr:hypothetical protein GCM10017594_17040 [Microbacterium terrae]
MTAAAHPRPDRAGMIYGMSANQAGFDTTPRVFTRHPGMIVGDGDPLEIHPSAGTVVAEGELAIVIGTAVHCAGLEAARAAIGGWALANDVTAVDLMTPDVGIQEGKGLATPLSTMVGPEFAAEDAVIHVSVNGEVRSSGASSLLRVRGPELVAWVSRTQHLLPGDVILCGAPAPAVPVRIGDRVRIWAEGLPSLENLVVDASTA